MNFVLTKHAQERIRSRVGITSEDAQAAWVNKTISEAVKSYPSSHLTVYVTKSFEFVCDKERVVTVSPVEPEKSYLMQLSGVVEKEVRKQLDDLGRKLRKFDIAVAERQLNFLKARNPNTKDIINEGLTKAIDEKQRVADEIYALKKAAKQYGVSV